MSDKTGIEWTDATWNPTTGCDKVSPGCDHCYAMSLAPRLKAMGSPRYQKDGDPRTSGPGFALTVHPTALDQPLRWKRSRRIFVNSMSDLFHKDVPDDFIAQVFAVMATARQHTFQVLTKRPGRMRSLLGSERFEVIVEAHARELDFEGYFGMPLPNVWLGTSVEDQKWADIRIPLLLDTPAAVRFLSCGPLLGEVDIFRSATIDRDPGIDWVIVDGESGRRARPMHPDWARSLRDQCITAGVPFLFKQWGEWVTEDQSPEDITLPAISWSHLGENEPPVWKVGKKAAGRELDGRTWDEYPEVVA